MIRLNCIGPKRGFTLLELILSMAIVSIVAVMISKFLMQGANTYSLASDASDANQTTSIAAFRITNTIRNVEAISLTEISGYEKLDITGIYPDIDDAKYKINVEDGSYSLSFTLTHKEGYKITSEVLLDNITSAVTGESTEIWYQASASVAEGPGFSVGAGSGAIIEGAGGTITFDVLTSGIDSGEALEVSLEGSPEGLSLDSESPVISSGEAEIKVIGTSDAIAGTYYFSINYPGAEESRITFFVVRDVPVIEVTNPLVHVIGEAFDPKQGMSLYDSHGADITAAYSSAVVVTGTVDTDTAGDYILIYNLTVEGDVAEAVSRTVRVVESGTPAGDPTITNVPDITTAVMKGSEYNAPDEIPAYWSDGTSSDVEVLWSGEDGIDTDTVGTYTITGTVNSYSGTVRLTVNVMPSVDVADIHITAHKSNGGSTDISYSLSGTTCTGTVKNNTATVKIMITPDSGNLNKYSTITTESISSGTNEFKFSLTEAGLTTEYTIKLTK